MQIDCNRKSSNDGRREVLLFYPVYHKRAGVIPYLPKYWYAEKALVPAIDWKVAPEVTPVSSITLKQGYFIGFHRMKMCAIRYVAFQQIKFRNRMYLNLHVIYWELRIRIPEFLCLPESVDMSSVTFAVAVFDRYGNEYTPGYE